MAVPSTTKNRGRALLELQRRVLAVWRPFLTALKQRVQDSPDFKIRQMPVLLATAVLVLLPLMIYIPDDGAIVRAVSCFWWAFLHFSPQLVALLVIVVSFCLAPDWLQPSTTSLLHQPQDDQKKRYKNHHIACNGPFCRQFWFHHPARVALLLTVVVLLSELFNAQLQMYSPSWFWFPFLWAGGYRVYFTHELAPALRGLCIDDYKSSSSSSSIPARIHDPLCLSPDSWNTLSAGYLSSRSSDDVITVKRGIQYAQEISGGFIIGVLARDVVHAVEPLRQNVEALQPFFPPNKVTVVVYENDSSDGTREAFTEWAHQAVGYQVHVMSCGPDNPSCKLPDSSNRYIATEKGKDYMESSSIGKMPRFRQTMLDFVLQNPAWQQYSHLMLVDLDLAVSFSPLGVLHSLGKQPNFPVASSARQPSAGSFGTMIPQYDLVAMRFYPTPVNARVLALHERFCHLAPPGDRWRFECQNVSMLLMLLLLDTTAAATTEPYKMTSAYNGAMLYPLKLVRESGGKYDAGDDGQRCEHVGFHLSLKTPVYINPKWSYHLDAGNPAGPRGTTSFNNNMRVMFFRPVSLIVYVQAVSFMYMFVASTMAIALYLLYPLAIVAGKRHFLGVRKPLPI